jgi:hypothetical protein
MKHMVVAAVTSFGASARYAALLMTFLSSAFFFSAEASTEASFRLRLWGVLVSAAFANVLMLPFKYLLPCVMSGLW